MSQKALNISALAFLYGVATPLHSRPDYLVLVPNADATTCLPCHAGGPGGSPRNAFGLAFYDNGFDWANVRDMDTDNDGQSNGQELGDPCGNWSIGSPPPRTEHISWPADENSMSDFPFLGSTVWFYDGDNDGVGVGNDYEIQCEAPSEQYSLTGTDCNALDSDVWEEAFVFTDGDGDGLGAGPGTLACIGGALNSGFSLLNSDCNDNDTSRYQYLPGFLDQDSDGYGGGELQWVCAGEELPPNFFPDKVDCDDNDSELSHWRNRAPDNDEDGVPDEMPQQVCVGENGNTGFWDGPTCDADSAACPANSSCDLMLGFCGALHLDCDATSPIHSFIQLAYVDADEDGYGAGIQQEACVSTPLPPGWSDVGTDCDDTPETGTDVYQWKTVYRDIDGDNYTQGGGYLHCFGDGISDEYSLNQQGEDCDDSDPDIYQELFGYPDLDQDGWTDLGQVVCTDNGLPPNWIDIKNGTDCDDNNDAAPQFLCENRPDLCGFVENGCPAPGIYCGPCPQTTDAGSALVNEDAGWIRDAGSTEDLDAGHSENNSLNETLDSGFPANEESDNSEDSPQKPKSSSPVVEDGGCFGQQIPHRFWMPPWLWSLLMLTWIFKRKRGKRQ